MKKMRFRVLLLALAAVGWTRSVSAFNDKDLGLYSIPKNLQTQILSLWAITQGGVDFDRMHLESPRWQNRPEFFPLLLHHAVGQEPRVMVLNYLGQRVSFNLVDSLSLEEQDTLLGPDQEEEGQDGWNQIGPFARSCGIERNWPQNAFDRLKALPSFEKHRRTWEQRAIQKSLHVLDAGVRFVKESVIGVSVANLSLPAVSPGLNKELVEEAQKMFPPNAIWRLAVKEQSLDIRIVTPLEASAPLLHAGVPDYTAAEAVRFAVPGTQIPKEFLDEAHARELAAATVVLGALSYKVTAAQLRQLSAPLKNLTRLAALDKMQQTLNQIREEQYRHARQLLKQTANQQHQIAERLRHLRHDSRLLAWAHRILPRPGAFRGILGALKPPPGGSGFGFKIPILTPLAVLAVGVAVGLDVANTRSAARAAFSFDDYSDEVARTLVHVGLGTALLRTGWKVRGGIKGPGSGLILKRAIASTAAKVALALFVIDIGLEVAHRKIDPDISTMTDGIDVLCQAVGGVLAWGNHCLLKQQGKSPIRERWETFRARPEFRFANVLAPDVLPADLADFDETQMPKVRELVELTPEAFSEELVRRIPLGRASVEFLAYAYAQGYLRLTLAGLQILESGYYDSVRDHLDAQFILTEHAREIETFVSSIRKIRDSFEPVQLVEGQTQREQMQAALVRIIYELRMGATLDETGELQANPNFVPTSVQAELSRQLTELYMSL